MTIKGKYDITQEENIIQVRIGENRAIWYGLAYDRKIVYYYKEDAGLFGFEEYNNHNHAPSQLYHPEFWYINRYIKLLFKNRLGDILFLTEREVKYLETNNILLRKASKEQFNKVKVIQGNIEFDETITVRGEQITLYHAEHGLIELPDNEYVAYNVPYFIKGHD